MIKRHFQLKSKQKQIFDFFAPGCSPPTRTGLLWKGRYALRVLYRAAESHAPVVWWVGWVELISLWHMLVLSPWGHVESDKENWLCLLFHLGNGFDPPTTPHCPVSFEDFKEHTCRVPSFSDLRMKLETTFAGTPQVKHKAGWL